MEQPSCIFRKEGVDRCQHSIGFGTIGEHGSPGGEAYQRLIEDGQNLGHDERYYQAVDQRFLGDENFIQKIVEQAPQAESDRGDGSCGLKHYCMRSPRYMAMEPKNSRRRDGSARGRSRGRNLHTWRGTGADESN